MSPRRYTLRTDLPARRPRIDLSVHLNEEQRAVVEAGEGKLLVIAGAGTGKTRTLTYRVAHLIDRGVPPEAILLLTFTNRAAREMVARVRDLVVGSLGVDLRRLWGGTFHHVANRTLRAHASVLGYREGYGILDRGDATDLIKACIAELGLAVAEQRFPRADLVLSLVSMAVNTERPLAEVIATRHPSLHRHTESLSRVAARYAERKVELNVMDFDDLLLNWKLLLMEHPEVLAAQGGRFRHVLVDEYQDTNRLQGDIVDRIASVHGNLMVVGDDAQSIYAFRGAHFANILDFPRRHPDAQIFHLTENYRSTPEILALANASIECNERQFRKTLRATRTSGPLPALVPARDVYEQAAFVAQRLLELRDEGIDLSEMAVLYRAHHHSLELQVELTRRQIPFQVRSGLRFFEQAHIKDVLAHLRFVVNPRDELAFRRMVRLGRGVGSATAERLWAWMLAPARTHQGPLEAFLHPDADAEVPSRARPAIRRLRDALTRIASPEGLAAPGEAIRTVLEEAGYAAHLREATLNADSRLEDLEQLADFAAGYEDLHAFLDEVGLLTEIEAEEVGEGETPDERLTLSTIHRAKGLEWRAVFLIWLADGRFPMAAAYRDAGEIEEERRLFYVAATRARDELYLCHPVTHLRRDRERILLKASPFVTELPAGDDAPYETWTLEPDPDPPALPPGTDPGLLEPGS